MKIKDLFSKIGLVISPILGGLLGAIGGSGNKMARRIGIPAFITGYAYASLEHIVIITIMSMAGALSIGYGIPDDKWYEEDIKISDAGSFLGRFWMKVFHRNKLLANIFTRGTIGILIALSLLSIPILKHNWISYIILSLGIILVQALISWRGFGTFKLFGKELSWVEFINWGLITLFAVLIIYFGGK
jgi:hypothetical protein